MSALPPKADILGRHEKGLLMTRSRHSLDCRIQKWVYEKRDLRTATKLTPGRICQSGARSSFLDVGRCLQSFQILDDDGSRRLRSAGDNLLALQPHHSLGHHLHTDVGLLR